MPSIRPFRPWIPEPARAGEISCPPYDVISSAEARVYVAEHPESFMRVERAETQLPEGTSPTDPRVYEAAKRLFAEMKAKGDYVREERPAYYLYTQRMGDHLQRGLVACVPAEDYFAGRIKKHELTRKDKEEDRMKHVRITNANVEPVFFAYPAVARIDEIVASVTAQKPVYDFIAKEDGFGHRFWVIDDRKLIDELVELFATKVPAMYIADGHHRSAAAALVGQEKKEHNPNHTGKEEYNYFMTVIFPDNQLNIIDYNRVVKDLNGLSKEQFLAAVGETYTVEDMGTEIYKPSKLHEFSMYLDGHWYKMNAKPGTFNDSDPIGVLDVTILSNLVLDKILGIKDLRTDKRIDFVGGIRGLGELKRRVDNGEMKVAFALYPVSMQQIIDIADTGNIMPPKTTWFEPKLRSGLVIHELA